MQLSGPLEEAVRRRGPPMRGKKGSKTSIPGIVWRKFEIDILDQVPEGERSRVVSRMGDAINSAQTVAVGDKSDHQHNVQVIATELRGAYRDEMRAVAPKHHTTWQMPKFHDFELVADGILWPIWQLKITDKRRIDSYIQGVALEIRNKAPVIWQDLDRAIDSASKWLTR